jgi:hypothetical protein
MSRNPFPKNEMRIQHANRIGVCNNLCSAACKLLILNGEMSEWLKEHAWKVLPAAFTERHRSTATHNQVNGLRLPNAPRCDAVFVPVLRGFQGGLTQFLHNS